MGESHSHGTQEGLDYSDQEQRKWVGPNSCIVKMESVHQLQKTEFCNKEGPFSSTFHWSDGGEIGRPWLLLFPRWLL